MGKHISINNLSLWEHQRNAVKKSVEYYKAFQYSLNTGNDALTVQQNMGSALVRMPTGTGKTGVFAVLAQCIPEIDSVLILAPSAAIRDQIVRDINFNFWETIGFDTRKLTKKAISFVPNSIGEVLKYNTTTPTIYVSTIQALSLINKDWVKEYNKLSKAVSLGIFDEGHREPAKEWSLAVRNLLKPTILFSATPYRNDLKQFNVNSSFITSYSHQQAVRNRHIRRVEISESENIDNIELFIDEVINYYNKKVLSDPPDGIENPKAIIRCSNSNRVKHVVNILLKKKLPVIGIHDTFSRISGNIFKSSVPNIKKLKKENIDLPTFWVHQYKLVEGIDEPEFCLLAILDPFPNARMLVQQVGRILRNPGKKPDNYAHILTHLGGHQKGYWEGYLEYEDDLEGKPGLYENRKIYDKYMLLLPKYRYDDKNYRKKFDILNDNNFKKYKYKLSTSVSLPDKDLSINDIAEGVRTEWFNNDLDIRKGGPDKPDDNTIIFTYLTYQNSPILIDTYTIQHEIGYTVIRLKNGVLLFYDSQNRSSSFIREHSKVIDPNTLKRLFDRRTGIVSNITLLNTDLGKYSIRRKNLQARSLQDIAPDLSDYSNFFSTAIGSTKSELLGRVNRYVGFTKGRISEISEFHEYTVYSSWLNQIIVLLSKTYLKTLPIFERFAEFVKPPDDCTPQNILLDIDDVQSSFKIESLKSRPSLNFEDICLNIIKKDSKLGFMLKCNNKNYLVKIKYDPIKQIYLLQNKYLDSQYVRYNSSGKKLKDTFTSYLNRNQSFRIIPANTNYIYAHGKFFKPRVYVKGKTDSDHLHLFNIFIPDKKITSLKEEKGDAASDKSGWKSGSVFHLIDNLGSSSILSTHMSDASILVCDDTGSNESCDFIFASNSKVAFIHAKAFKRGRKQSASAFHDVCGQAIKNLNFLTPTSDNIPPNMHLWRQSWKANKQEVSSRVRIGDGSPQEIWNRLKALIRDPNIRREVWIVVGNGFSIDEFKKNVNSNNPSPEFTQIIFLMQSTWGVVQSIGARLRIFC